jgi:hypothetical protein
MRGTVIGVSTRGDEPGYDSDDAETREERRGELGGIIRGSISGNRWSIGIGIMFVDLDGTLRLDGTSDGDMYATSDSQNIGVVRGIVHGVHEVFLQCGGRRAFKFGRGGVGKGELGRRSGTGEGGDRGRATLKGGGVTRTNWACGSGFLWRRRQMFWKKPIVENTSTVCWLLRRLGD